MNNVYVRSNNSLSRISITRIITLIPMILFGIYYNGYLAYKTTGGSLMMLFNPIKYILVGIIIGILVNVIFTKKTKNMKLLDILFSSFLIEYGIIIGSLMNDNVNIIIYGIVTLILFIIAKLLDIKINIMALIIVIITVITMFTNNGVFYTDSFLYNTGDAIKNLLIGYNVGGLCATSFILLLISFVVLNITNSSKTKVTFYSYLFFVIVSLIISLIKGSGINILEIVTILTSKSMLFIFMYVASDSLSSSYTNNGTIIYGIICGILEAIIPIKCLGILVASIFHVFIDKQLNRKSKN